MDSLTLCEPKVNPTLYRLNEKRVPGTGPTGEHWSPCIPQLRDIDGRPFYVGAAVFCFLDGRSVIRATFVVPAFANKEDLLLRSCREASALPRIGIEDFWQAEAYRDMSQFAACPDGAAVSG
jgi:hypothetical protein